MVFDHDRPQLHSDALVLRTEVYVGVERNETSLRFEVLATRGESQFARASFSMPLAAWRNLEDAAGGVAAVGRRFTIVERLMLVAQSLVLDALRLKALLDHDHDGMDRLVAAFVALHSEFEDEEASR